MDGIMWFFIVLGTSGLLLLASGLRNKSLASLLFGGGALAAPVFFYSHLGFLMPMIPAAVMAIFYLIQKKDAA